MPAREDRFLRNSPAEAADYAPVPVPGAGEAPTPEVLAKEIDDWISSPAFADLAASDGGQPAGSLSERPVGS